MNKDNFFLIRVFWTCLFFEILSDFPLLAFTIKIVGWNIFLVFIVRDNFVGLFSLVVGRWFFLFMIIFIVCCNKIVKM
jgi:hypothetical protein